MLIKKCAIASIKFRIKKKKRGIRFLGKCQLLRKVCPDADKEPDNDVNCS